MQVTARLDYALQTMLAVAEARGEPISVAALAERLDVSYPYLSSVVGELRRAGLLRVRRGAAGGLLLAGPAEEITLGDVVVAVDGPLVLPDHEALGGDGCTAYLRGLWLSAHRAMVGVFAEIPLTRARAALETPTRRTGDSPTRSPTGGSPTGGSESGGSESGGSESGVLGRDQPTGVALP